LPVKYLPKLLSQATGSEIKNWLQGDGHRTIYYAEQGNSIVGAAASSCIGNFCYLWGMYVRESSQGMGVGSLLLESCARTAKLQGCSTIELTVLALSVDASEFYRNRGFAEIETTSYPIVEDMEMNGWRMQLGI